MKVEMTKLTPTNNVFQLFLLKLLIIVLKVELFFFKRTLLCYGVNEMIKVYLFKRSIS